MIDHTGNRAAEDLPKNMATGSDATDGNDSRPEAGGTGVELGIGRSFHLVVMGTGPVGKTSLINAMLGRSVGETGATMGTTRGGQTHTHAVEGVEGTLLLTDTPGLGEAGPEGSAREAEAMELATRADLLVFVVDHDLTRADCQAVFELARQGKRLIVALNKKDRFTEEDREAILAKLRERLDGFVPVEDIVAVAAAPAPVQVRVRKPDGTTETVLEDEAPDLEALECRVAAVLEREGDALAPATSCSGPACASRPSGTGSPGIAARGPWRSSSGTSGSRR